MATKATEAIPAVTMPAATSAKSVQSGASLASSAQPPTAITTSRRVPASSGPPMRPAPWAAK